MRIGGINLSSIHTKIFLVIFAVTYVVLFLFKAQHQFGDSLSYAYDIKSGADLYNPHHVLFSPIVYVFSLLLRALQITSDAIVAAQLHNIFWASLGTGFIYLISERLFKTRLTAVLAALFFIPMNMYWIFSTQVEVYIPAISSLILIFYLLFYAKKNELGRRRLILIGFILVLSMGYHQTALLLLVPLIGLFYYRNKERGLLKAIPIILVMAVFGLALYVFAASRSVHSTNSNDIINYFFAYAVAEHPNWGTFDHYGYQGLLKLVHSQLFGIVNISSDTGILIAELFGYLILLLIGWNLTALFRKANFKDERLFCLLWLAAYYVFLLWWTPGYTLLSLTLFPLVILFFIALADVQHYMDGKNLMPVTRYVSGIILSGLIIALATNNYASFQYYKKDKGPAYAEAEWINTNVGNDCLPVVTYGSLLALNYYFDIEEVVFLEDIMNEKYFGRSFNKNLPKLDVDCFIVPVWQVNPWKNYEGMTGIKNPEKWKDYFDFIFDCQVDEQTGIVNSKTFDLIPSGGEYQYALFRIYTERGSYNSYEELFVSLDRSILEAGIENEDVYKWWGDEYLQIFQ
ncbi:MAG: DUF2723 domain-containing protein [Bacteroidetes bacterium]|nr:DUF2723 domain-containing protein [Bacteroidota bacterium]